MRKMKLQFFAGESDGIDALDTLLAGMDDAQSTSSNDEPEAVHTEPDEPQQPNAEDTQPQQTQQKPSAAERQNYAFGQMRVENTQLKEMLGKLAKATGIEYKDERELLSKLNNFSIENLAKQQNVPVEFLQRLDVLEQNNRLYEQEQRKQQVLLGFQTLKNNYGLNDEQLLGFVHELNEAGRNPLTVDINIEDAYKTMHFDDILSARVQKEVQAALAKSSVADTHSTTPNSKSGKGDDGSTTKINSVSALTDMLKDVKLN